MESTMTRELYPNADIICPGYQSASPSDDWDGALPSMDDVVLCP